MRRKATAPNRIRRALCSLALLISALLLPRVVRAETPFVVDEWKLGRHDAGATLTYCVDQRDPDWSIASQIAQQIAGALLLEPKEILLKDRTIGDDLDDLYRILRETCDVFMGFKLAPDVYPDWLTVTRPYYRGSYVIAVRDGKVASLSDIPVTGGISATLGTVADIRLAQFLMATKESDRWRRFPMANDEAALRAVLDGTADAALVWGPAYWGLRADDASFAKLRTIDARPLPAMSADIGAALLSPESFLRASIDQAISALAADGTLAKILTDRGFPGQAIP